MSMLSQSSVLPDENEKVYKEKMTSEQGYGEKTKFLGILKKCFRTERYNRDAIFNFWESQNF